MAIEINHIEVFPSYIQGRTRGFFGRTITIPIRTIVAVDGPDVTGWIGIKTMDGEVYTHIFGMFNRAKAVQVRDAILLAMR